MPRVATPTLTDDNSANTSSKIRKSNPRMRKGVITKAKDEEATVHIKSNTKTIPISTSSNNDGDCVPAGTVSKGRQGDNKTFVDLKTQEERRNLLTAIQNEKEDEVKRLVRKEGYNTNFIDEDDPLLQTPLHIATQQENVKIVKYLLRAKPYPAKINVENKRHWRPIWLAAWSGNAELTEVLLSDTRDKCDVNYIDKESGMSPLYRAILSKSSEVCRHLIHAGADVNMRRLEMHGAGSAAETPLIKAVQLNNLGICEVLVNSLVDLQAKTAGGFTALHYAVAYRRYSIARYLLDERIKVQARAKNGITPMTIAISENLPAMAWILIEYGYNMDKRFQWGETPLEMAIRVHAQECAMVMLQWGCSLVLKDKKKPSYFNMACNEGLACVIKYLADLNPRYLQEQWLKDRNLPVALYKQQEIYEWLFEESTQVRRLTQLCNAKIIRYLGKFTCTKIDKLPLPDKLKEPLRFKEYFSGKFVERKYREKSLFTKECPFDCPPMCPRSQCPEIEFSDSGSEYEYYTDSDSDTEENRAIVDRLP